MYVTNKKVENVSAVIGETSKGFDNVDRGYFLELGQILAGQEVVLEAENEGNPTLQAEVWRFNPQGLAQVYEAMNESPMEIASFGDRELLGTVTAAERGTLFTTIPYDAGWTVLVDKTAADTRPVFDTFLGIDLEAGEHEISLVYTPQGLNEGRVISAVSAAVLAALAGGDWVFRRRNRKMEISKNG